MKNLFLPLILGLAFVFYSCDSDPCKDTICESHAICQEGTCECEVGYKRNFEGRCVLATDIGRDKFVRSWNVLEYCTNGNYPFISTITKSLTEKDQLIIYNFYDTYSSVYAVMTTATTFDIPLQIQNGDAISGKGAYTAGSLTLDYSISDFTYGTTDQCSATYN